MPDSIRRGDTSLLNMMKHSKKQEYIA